MTGRTLEAGLHLLDRQLIDEDRRRPGRVSFGVVKRIESAVELSVPRAELETNRLEAWTRHRLIGRLPGAGDAPD